MISIAVFDLRAIRLVVDNVFDYFATPKKTIRMSSRQDLNGEFYKIEEEEFDIKENDEALRATITKVIGAFLQQQKCWERFVCTVGVQMKELGNANTLIL